MRRRNGASSGGFSYVAFYGALTLLVLAVSASLSVAFYYGNKQEVVREITTTSTTTGPSTTTSTTTITGTGTTTTITTTTPRTAPPTTPAPVVVPGIVRIYQVSTSPDVIGMDITTTTSNVPVYAQCTVSFHESEASTLESDQTPKMTLLNTLLSPPLNGIMTFTDVGFVLTTFPISTVFVIDIQYDQRRGERPKAAAHACYNSITTQYDVFVVYSNSESSFILPFGRCLEDVTFGVYTGTGIDFTNQCVYCDYYARNCQPLGILPLTCAGQYIGTTTTETTTTSLSTTGTTGTGPTTTTTTTPTTTTAPPTTTPIPSLTAALISRVYQQTLSPVPIIGQNVSLSLCATSNYANSYFAFMSGNVDEEQESDQTPKLVKLTPLLGPPTNGILTYSGVTPITDNLATFPTSTVFTLTIYNNNLRSKQSLSTGVMCYNEISTTFTTEITVNGEEFRFDFESCLSAINKGKYVGTDITPVIQCLYCRFFTYNCVALAPQPNMACVTAFFAGTPIISSVTGILANYAMNVLYSSTPGYDYANGYVVLPTGTYRSTETATQFQPLIALLTPPVNGILTINPPVQATPPAYFVFQFSTWPNGGNGRTPAVAVACFNSNLGDFSNFITVTGIYLTDNFLGCLLEINNDPNPYALVGINALNHCNFCQYSTQNCGRTTQFPNITCIGAFLETPTTTPTTTTTTAPPTTTTGTGTTSTAPPTTPPIGTVAIISSVLQEALLSATPFVAVNISHSSVASTAFFGQISFSNTTKNVQRYSDQTHNPNTGVSMTFLLGPSVNGIITFGINGSVSPYPPPQSRYILQSFPTTNAFQFFITNSSNFAYPNVVASSYACQRLQDNTYSFITSFGATDTGLTNYDFCSNLFSWPGSPAIPFRSRFVCPYCTYVFQNCNGTSTNQCALQFSQSNPFPLFAGASQRNASSIGIDFSPSPTLGNDFFVGIKLNVYETLQNATQQSDQAPDVPPYTTLDDLLGVIPNMVASFSNNVNISDHLATLPPSAVFSMRYYFLNSDTNATAMTLLCFNNYTSTFSSIYLYTSISTTYTITQCFLNYATLFPGQSLDFICANCNTLV